MLKGITKQKSIKETILEGKRKFKLRSILLITLTGRCLDNVSLIFKLSFSPVIASSKFD